MKASKPAAEKMSISADGLTILTALAALLLSAWEGAACLALLTGALLALRTAVLQGSKALKDVCAAGAEVSMPHLNVLPALCAARGRM
jgi:hypothetical protein